MSKPKKDKEAAIKSEIEKLIKESAELLKEKPSRQNNGDLNALAATISEFLDCFIVLGYDTQGNAVHITLSHTDKEANALSNFLMDFASGSDEILNTESCPDKDSEDEDDSDEEDD